MSLGPSVTCLPACIGCWLPSVHSLCASSFRKRIPWNASRVTETKLSLALPGAALTRGVCYTWAIRERRRFYL